MGFGGLVRVQGFRVYGRVLKRCRMPCEAAPEAEPSFLKGSYVWLALERDLQGSL